MTLPFYVSPEQQMLDRAEFARKGIARGRSVIVQRYRDGIALVAENHSTTLHKVAELYDRIGFAAVGRYNEFEALRIAGIRHADLRGYAYDRRDVTGRSLAGAYSQLLGGAFASAAGKPYEVDLIVAELGERPELDVIYKIGYDGVITDEPDLAVIGGEAERISAKLRQHHDAGADLPATLQQASEALDSSRLEAAFLSRVPQRRRAFRRLTAIETRQLCGTSR